jgi:hypothetical protein
MKESLVFALSLTMFPACTTHSQTLRPESEIYDGFEARDLSDIWNTSKFEPGAVVIQSEMVRAGKSAAKITIRQGDRYDAADPSTGTKENERDELLERKNLSAREEKTWSYAWHGPPASKFSRGWPQ